MVIRQITNEKVVSLEDMDKQLVNRQSAIKTVPVENVPEGLTPGTSIQIDQTPNYKSNIDPKVG